MLKSKEGKASNSIILERRILKSVLYGHWSAGYAKQNCEDLKELAKEFEDNHWGFIADMLELEPIQDAETSNVFSGYHEELYDVGCRAVAFITTKKASVKARPDENFDIAKTKELLIGHFNNYDDALEWFKSLGL